MTFGSLFAGIGGFDLGLERAGLICKWQVEIDPFCQRVLAKHWPNVRRHDDVRTFPPEGDWAVDVVCGGFPCQPVSVAGLGKVQQDDRWLWPEFARIIGVLRPRFAILENVPGLLVRGFSDVLGNLAALGYDAEWSILSSCRVVAPHPRQRMFLVAYPTGRLGQTGLRFRERAAAHSVSTGNNITTEVLRMESAYRNCRGPDGVSPRLDRRIRSAGNAVQPQLAEWIGRLLIENAREE